MKTINYYLTFILLFFVTTLMAQFRFDTTKIENIRWSPLPKTVMNEKTLMINLNGKWDFYTNPDKNFPSSTKEINHAAIEVPGEWIMQGFDVEKGKFAGYKRDFTLPTYNNELSYKLRFEAVYSYCEVFMNGKKAGSHLGGFTPFEIDITEFIKTGHNTLALKVKSETIADTLSSASKYAVHPLGGITRPVTIVALPKINIASFHVNTTFDKEYKNATLSTELIIANEGSATSNTQLKFSLTDAGGNNITLTGKNEMETVVDKNGKLKTKISFNIKEPAKWDPEHPNLYYLHCTLTVDGKQQETVTRRFGFRQIEVRKNRVFVNNKPIKLRGACRHEVDPLRGRSLTGDIWRKDIMLFKKANVNYIRTSHYPPNEKLLEACDELGMFVEEEAPFCWAHTGPVNDRNYFEAILQPTIEMVERDRSHPSILMWSLANESHNFNELFKKSADIVKAIDPSRPRVFSFWAENADFGYLEINNDHYCGPEGPEKYSSQKRPITIDEYAHLNAYNRFELMTDPGLRDFWGEGFYLMWEKMYKTESMLGGAIWAGIDDSFFLPSGEAVGYGTWGPLDGWRRKKPEYWHVKKTYSPVKIELMDTKDDEPVKLKIENRYLFTNLNECTFKWTNNGVKETIIVSIEPGKQKTVSLPFKRKELQKLTIDVFKNSKIPVDSYIFDISPAEVTSVKNAKAGFKFVENDNSYTVESKVVKATITKTEFKISNADGKELISSLPRLMIIPLNPKGSGVQMTKETPEFSIFSPAAANRKIKKIKVEHSKSNITIALWENYDEASGNMLITLSAEGDMKIDYEYVMNKDINPRQWGISFVLPDEMQTLQWNRKGLWTNYPDDHIGRLTGRANAFNDTPVCGLAGPKTKPDHPWSEDQTSYGTNDFRSTKRNIFTASLTNKNEMGIEVLSGGLQSIRCWYENDNIHMLVAEYVNPGAERFFRSHAQQWDKPLKRGDKISGSIHLKTNFKLK